MSFADLKTKKDRIEYIKEMIAKSDRWLLKGLFTIFDNQTEDEKHTSNVKENNGIGFTGIDAQILTSFATHLISRGARSMLENKQPITANMFLSPKQEAILRNKMQKYARQLANIANMNYPIVKTHKP